MVNKTCGYKMDRKTKKEQKKKQKWGKSVSSSPDVVVSAAAPAEGVQAPSSSSRKRKFPSLRRVFSRMLCFLSCVSSCEVDESIEARSTSVDTCDDASSSPAVSRASDPEVELQAKTQEKEAIEDVAGEQSSASSTEDTSTSTDSPPSDLLYATLGMEVIGEESSTSTSTDGSFSYGPSDLETSGVFTSSSADDFSSSPEDYPSDLETSGVYTSSSAVGVSSSEDSEKIDLLAEIQATAVLEGAAGDQAISDADLDYILGVIAGMTVQSKGLSPAEILQLIQGSPQQEQIEVEQQSSGSDTEDDVELADVVATASLTKIKHLGFPNLGNTCYMNSVLQCLLTVSPFRDDVLSQRERWNDGSTMLRALTDLHMTRLTGNDMNLKAKLLSTVKRCIETRHPDFLGDHQQDAHEFLMVCLSHLKEEGELLQSYWPQYTCPVANMEFQLKRRRTCDSCGFQRSFREDSNYLSLVIGPQGCLVDSLQQYFTTSSFECSCSECAGSTASEALELITLPRVLVLLVMRFDVTSSLRKMKNRLEVPEDFALSCGKESREMRVIKRKDEQRERTKKDRVETAGQQVEASEGCSSAQYRLAGVVSHLGSSLYCGHYISHIRDFTGSRWLGCSDTSIRRSSWSKASRNIGKNGYMLFYVKS
uniref:Ubiquitin carboxyl-terminal hydrolase n=1 Tax=Cyprinus carpio TaxID=7962 RepID=A0A8C2KIU0_CYPCA